MLPLVLFPYFPDIKIWFVLRLIVGIGDSALHYAAQLWVLLVTTPEKRGRYISLYGMSYGLGFSIGPLGIKLLGFGDAVPFLVLFVGMAAVFILVLVKLPEHQAGKSRACSFAGTALSPQLRLGLVCVVTCSFVRLYGSGHKQQFSGVWTSNRI